ncbi:MAG: hypothetical protein OEW33_12090 [Nitrospirota bacterium]|nr:hypothetical protein [Nitrospirota bacterium]MDH5296035.1 hypothetical protein [Nitrospirota bacterium]
MRPVWLPFLMCSLALVTSANAIPPTPPVQLELPKAEGLAALIPEKGMFTVPVRVLVHQDVAKLTLIVRTNKMGMLGWREGQVKDYALKGLGKAEPQTIEIKIPLQEKDGLYRVEAAVQIEQKGKTGVVSKGVLIQVVEKGRQRLTTPAELRRTQVLQKKQAFQEALAGKPKQPDIRLLMDNMVPVPAELTKHIKPYTGPKQKRAGESGPPAAIKPYILDKTKNDKKNSRQRQNPGVVPAQFGSPVPLFEISGQVVLEDWYTNVCTPDPSDPFAPCTLGPNVLTPLANATIVILLDLGGGFDAGLDITETDENGFWSVYLDPALAGSNVYYTVSLENQNFNVLDAAGNDYIWVSSTRPATGIVNFGQAMFTTNVEAAQVFSTINRAWNHIVTEGGQDPGLIEVRYPDSCLLSDGTITSCWDPSGEVVRLESETNTGPDITLHEYGHALLHYAFGFSPGGGPHSFSDLEQDLGVAFNEGWATAFSLSVCPDGLFNWSEWPYQDPAGGWPLCTAVNYAYGEWIEGFSFNNGQNRKGERHEGRVAAALTDFLDDPNDDNGGNEDQGKNGYEDANENDRTSLATIYRDSMWGFSFGDFINFYIQLWSGLTNTMRPLADDIMTYNWMSWPITVPVPETVCVASKVAMAMSPDYGKIIDGLRVFRDKVMKPLVVGRHWMQSYYSHSPEMAMLLIGDSEARQAGQVVVEHFSGIGHTLRELQGLERLSQSQEAVLPPRVIESIKKISQVIKIKGSEELKQKLVEVHKLVKTFEDLSVSQAVQKVSAMEKAGRGKEVLRVQPMKFAPGSQTVDWDLIKKHLPHAETPGTKRTVK